MKWPLLTGLFSPLLLSACMLGQVGAVIKPTLSGNLRVRAVDGTETQWTPDRCTSGDMESFVGFDFLSSQDHHQLRALRDPISGPVVRWKSADTQSADTILRRDDCTVLDLDIHPTAWRVNEVREFAGHVELQCRATGGTRIEGRLTVDHCH